MLKNSGLFKEEKSPPQSTINLDSGLASQNTQIFMIQPMYFQLSQALQMLHLAYVKWMPHDVVLSLSQHCFHFCQMFVYSHYASISSVCNDGWWPTGGLQKAFWCFLLINFSRHDFISKWVQKPNTAVIKYLTLKPTNSVTKWLIALWL